MFAPLSVCRDYQLSSHMQMLRTAVQESIQLLNTSFQSLAVSSTRGNRTATTALGCHSLGDVCMCVQWMFIEISGVFVEFGSRS